MLNRETNRRCRCWVELSCVTNAKGNGKSHRESDGDVDDNISKLRQGKSTLIHHLLERMSKKFDLVVSFMGTSACSPEMRTLMETKFDPRFVFAEWNEPLMKKLLQQLGVSTRNCGR